MIRCGENTVERKILIAVAQNGNSLNTQNQSSRKVLGLVQEHRSPSDKIGLLLVFSIRAPQQDQENTQTPIEIDRHFPWHRHAGDPLHGERQDSKSDTEKRRQVDQGQGERSQRFHGRARPGTSTSPIGVTGRSGGQWWRQQCLTFTWPRARQQ